MSTFLFSFLRNLGGHSQWVLCKKKFRKIMFFERFSAMLKFIISPIIKETFYAPLRIHDMCKAIYFVTSIFSLTLTTVSTNLQHDNKIKK